MQKKISSYSIVSQIYESANSLVYRAEEKNNPVILKILKLDHPSSEELIRYNQEYEILKNLKSEWIIRVYGIEKHMNTLMIIEEDFGGESLAWWLKKRKFTLEEFLGLAIKILEGIKHIHHANIIHKDINPSNIIWNPKTSELKIIDFGISTLLDNETADIGNIKKLEGTLAYISPEQTGRMNRSIDYRTDFYSLGVTFYEMLTGHLPFETSNIIELVYNHLAKKPVPPNEIDKTIPEAISQIILKLMEKTAENRYQSITGLQSDLRICLKMLKNSGDIKLFGLYKNDLIEKLNISKKLYGRENETNLLLEAFDRISKGNTEFTPIGGYPGIGKTSLVNEVHKPITNKNGCFCSGKYSRFQKNIPYTGIALALEEFIKNLFTENKENLEIWKKRILKAVGRNGQILNNLLPSLKLIIGEQPPVPDVESKEAQNRFSRVFINFLHELNRPEQPLVLFLDDLQWADIASLNLLKTIISDKETRNLLIIGAYRDNEVDAAHPLKILINELLNTTLKIHSITLQNLSKTDTNKLIADTFNSTKNITRPLMELVYEKTAGNAFFVKEFLKTLNNEGLIYVDTEKMKWKWQIQKIRDKNITNNVIDLMNKRISRLGKAAQNTIKKAACLGFMFSLEMLAAITVLPKKETIKCLWPSIKEGLIIPLDEEYKLILYQTITKLAIENTPDKQIYFRFVHDHVRQAAYELVSKEKLTQLHLDISRLLLENTPKENLDTIIFSIVDHYNIGIPLIEKSDELINLSKLNLKAGKKAKKAAAFETAGHYFNIGIISYPGDIWNEDYEFAVELYLSAAEGECLQGNFNEAEKLFTDVQNKARNIIDKSRAYEIEIIQYTNQTRYNDAANTGIKALKLFDINFPEINLKDEISIEAAQLEANIKGLTIKDFLNLPEMVDEKYFACLNLMVQIFSPFYVSKPELLLLLALKAVNLSVNYGNCPASAFLYSVYSIALVAAGRHEEADAFGKLARQLNEKLNDYVFKSKVYMNSTNSNRWCNSLSADLQLLKTGYEAGLDSGDFIYAGYSCTEICIDMFNRGIILKEVNDNWQIYYSFVEKTQNPTVLLLLILKQLVLNLQGKLSNNNSLNSEDFNEEQFCSNIIKTGYGHAIHYYHLCKMVLAIFNRDPESGLSMIGPSEQNLNGVIGQFTVALHTFYAALILAGVFNNATPEEQSRYREQLKVYLKQLEVWAANCKANFLHMQLLVEAEIARIDNKNMEVVIDLYEQAINAAKENEILHLQALANELTGSYWLDKGKERIAMLYLAEAHYLYGLWGASAKVKQMEQMFPVLKKSSWENQIQSGITVSTTNNIEIANDFLDIQSIFKTAQTLSSKLEMSTLLKHLMEIVIQNTGAQKALLISSYRNQFLIDAEYSINKDRTVLILPEILLEDCMNLSHSIINYVIKTEEHIILANASKTGLFINDPYIKENNILSVLCMPVKYKGKLITILCLENNLIENAFMPNRIKTLNVLVPQIAISLENARLFSQQKEIEESLRESEEKYRFLIEKMNDGIIVVNENRIITFVNNRFCIILQRLREELINHHIMEFCDEDNKKIFEYQIKERLKGKKYSYELEWTRKNGTKVLTNLSPTPAIGEDDIIKGSFAIVTDITEKKEMEMQLRQSEKMQVIGQLAGGIAHDFNNQLAAILGNAELLQNEVGNDYNITQYIDNIITSIKHSSNLTSQLLAFSYKGKYEITSVDVHGIIFEIVNILQHSIDKRITIQQQLKANPPTILGDPSQIQNALLNIVLNARDSMPDGGDISFYTDTVELNEDFCSKNPYKIEKGKYIEVSITDTGTGMAKETQNHIFEPFFTTKKVGKGTGMGLAAVYGTVKNPKIK